MLTLIETICLTLLSGSLTVAFGQCTTPGFASMETFAVGANPGPAAIGDFNGDGRKDVVVANAFSSRIALLLGKADGGFGPLNFHNVQTNPASIVVDDFNGDKKQDLAVANSFSDSISVLIGDGAGSFAVARHTRVGTRPVSIAAGDFNGDGKHDLAVANFYTHDISILLGDGAGNFPSASPVPARRHPRYIAVGEFNGDGKVDLAALHDGSNAVSILLGNGAGAFSLHANSFNAGVGPYSIAIWDFNGDRNQDLAVTNFGGNSVSIMLGDGRLNFGAAASFRVGQRPTSLALGDFNGDGKQDIAVTNFNGGNVSVLLGSGQGGVEKEMPFPIGQKPVALAIEDFNLDGRQDLLIVGQGAGNTVDNGRVLLNTCNAPNLTLTKGRSGGLSFTAGRNDSYSLTVANAGAAPTSGPITVTDPLPNGLDFISGSGAGWTCSLSARTVTCLNPGPIAPGSRSRITLVVAVGHPAVPKVINTARVANRSEVVLWDNGAQDEALVNPSSDLAVDYKDLAGTTKVDSDITYTVTLNNRGPSPAVGVTLVDSLPQALKFVSVTPGTGSCKVNGTVVCSLGEITPRGAVTITIVAKALTVGTVSNTVTVTGKNVDLDITNNSKTGVTAIVGRD